MRIKLRAILLGVLASIGLAAANPAHAQVERGTELKGIIDIHWHAGPPTYQSITRSLDAYEAALVAKRHGFRAIVIKQHYLETASWAYLISRTVEGVQIFGGVALNRSVGGVNPVAVENVLTFPEKVGRIVFMPTFESEHYNRGSPVAVPVSKDGKLLPEVLEVLDVIAKYDAALSTGHSSPEESLMLVREAQKRGIRVFVQHPLDPRIAMSVEQMEECVRMGAFLEFILAEPVREPEFFDHWAEVMREVGPENVIISSDLGQRGNAIPPDGYRIVLPKLREAGFSEAELDLMTKDNPAYLLGLDAERKHLTD